MKPWEPLVSEVEAAAIAYHKASTLSSLRQQGRVVLEAVGASIAARTLREAAAAWLKLPDRERDGFADVWLRSRAAELDPPEERPHA